jgi:hypothetical protein
MIAGQHHRPRILAPVLRQLDRRGTAESAEDAEVNDDGRDAGPSASGKRWPRRGPAGGTPVKPLRPLVPLLSLRCGNRPGPSANLTKSQLFLGIRGGVGGSGCGLVGCARFRRGEQRAQRGRGGWLVDREGDGGGWRWQRPWRLTGWGWAGGWRVKGVGICLGIRDKPASAPCGAW